MRSRDIKEIQILTQQERVAIEELVSKARNHFIVKDIILFGSKARGDSNEQSDVDIMVIIDGMESKINDIEYLKLPLPSNISKEGVVLRV